MMSASQLEKPPDGDFGKPMHAGMKTYPLNEARAERAIDVRLQTSVVGFVGTALEHLLFHGRVGSFGIEVESPTQNFVKDCRAFAA
jgi:hypothetical protein